MVREWSKGLRKYFSHSQLEMFSQCGLKYNFKYIQDIKKPSSSNALVFGGAIHKAIEKYHLSILNERLTARQIMDAFEDHWTYQLEHAEIPIKFKNGEQDKLFEIGLDIIAKYYKDNKNIPPPCMFINSTGELVPAVEIDFMIEIKNPITQISRPINGKIDLITPIDKKKNAEIYVIDHKTSAEDYTQFKINTSVQLSLYAYAFRQLLASGRFPYITKKKEDAVGYNVFKKIESTKAQPDNYGEIRYIRKVVTDIDIEHMITMYGMFDTAVTNGVYIPNYSRQCSWCPYQEDCTEFKYHQENK